MPEPRLVATHVPRRAEAIALVLHGGASREHGAAVSPTQLSVLRMLPVAGRLARAGRGRLAVFRLLNSTRGWDTAHTPVDDARWALDQVEERLGRRLPTALVGHSLGGRAAILAGDADGVESVVALNPWVYPSDTVDLTGRRVLVAHGTDDRIADPGRARTVAAALTRTARSVGVVDVEGARHAMLRRGGVFERLAADFVRATLLGDDVSAPVPALLEGDQRVSV